MAEVAIMASSSIFLLVINLIPNRFRCQFCDGETNDRALTESWFAQCNIVGGHFVQI
jgi:hypothetical protein